MFGCNTVVTKEIEKPKTETTVIVQELPMFDFAYVAGGLEDKISPNDLAVAMAIFYLSWEEEFGDPQRKILHNLNNINILMDSKQEEVRNCYDIEGNFLPIAYANGLTYNPQTIWIWSADLKVSNTSFIHELVHVALWTENEDNGDPDHEGPKYMPWSKRHTEFIKEINELLKKMGI